MTQSESKPEPIVKCAVCGEDTTHDRESSFYGNVHRWGPTDHQFTPIKPEAPRIVAECWTCYQRRNPERPVANHAGDIYSQRGLDLCRAAGHDVREVSK